MKPDQRILALLARRGPDLTSKEIGDVTGLWFWRLHPALYRLQRTGQVQSRSVPGPEPRRWVYWMWQKRRHMQPRADDQDCAHITADLCWCGRAEIGTCDRGRA